jgi:hypothetical protein
VGQTAFKRKKPSPRGRWHDEGVTDEGRLISQKKGGTLTSFLSLNLRERRLDLMVIIPHQSVCDP